MALIEFGEPPSSHKTKEDELKNKVQTKRRFLNKAYQKAFLKVQSYAEKILPAITFTKEKLIEFCHFFIRPQFLPHFAIAFLFLVVMASDYSAAQAQIANANSTALDPNTESNILNSVNPYIAVIPAQLVSDYQMNYAVNSNGGFVNSAPPLDTQITSTEAPLPDNSAGDVNYVVSDGDTLTAISWKFNVSISTLQYVNNLDNADLIRPGMQLKIPKKGYEVSAIAIAQKEATQKAQAAAATQKATAAKNAASALRAPKGSVNNGYPWGWCTYYVATRRAVPANWGNAGQWLSSARSQGWSTGKTPVPGAIMVTSESWWGHVAYVERVDGNSVTVSEMNATAGFGAVDQRTFDAGSRVIKGFIY